MTDRRELTDEWLDTEAKKHWSFDHCSFHHANFAKAIIAADRALQGEGCTRSHPHENMSAECEMKTVKARLDFLDAQHSPTSVDPLQATVNWLNQAMIELTVTDVQTRLFVGYNRAKRLLDAARAAQGATE